MKAINKDYATQDLFDHIAKGGSASWTWKVQIMPEKDADTYRFDVFDVTKVWPHSDYPLIPVGKLVLNKNPENYHAEVEQAAFAPTNLVPGIEPSNDKMLQGRLFSYPDTHRHRLGPNFDQIPINCPYKARVSNYQRDGPSVVNGNQGSGVNYEPNSHGGPVEDPTKKWAPQPVTGHVGRYAHQHPNDNYEQPRALFRKVMSETDRQHLIENIVGAMKGARRDIQERMIKHFFKVDPEYGGRIAKGLGLPTESAKL